jgi:hypothetical protein
MNPSSINVFDNPREAEKDQLREWKNMTPEERLQEQAELKKVFEEGALRDPSLIEVRSLHDDRDHTS